IAAFFARLSPSSFKFTMPRLAFIRTIEKCYPLARAETSELERAGKHRPFGTAHADDRLPSATQNSICRSSAAVARLLRRRPQDRGVYSDRPSARDHRSSASHALSTVLPSAMIFLSSFLRM